MPRHLKAHNFSDVIIERKTSKLKKRANEKLIHKTHGFCFGYGVRMIRPKESEWVHQVVRHIHSPPLIVQRDNKDSKTTKNVNGYLIRLGHINLIFRSGSRVCQLVKM